MGDQDLLDRPYEVRRKHLEELVEETDTLKLAKAIVTDKAEEIKSFFNSSIESGGEGLIAKDLKSVYSAGARGWSWIKLKESYQSKIVDTIDAVIVGAEWGMGRRAQMYGNLLCCILNKASGNFQTICKVGSGLSDDLLASLPEKFKSIIRNSKSPQVEATLTADIWFEPEYIIEILGDELTLSTVHTAGFNKIAPKSGLAIRFPRFIRWREDKSKEDITTTDEVIEMYQRQIKTV